MHEQMGAQDFPPATPWSYGAVLLRHRFLTIGLPIIIGLGAGIWSRVPARRYVASSRFLPQEAGGSALAGLGQFASQLGLIAPKANTTSPQFYADLLESKEVLRDAVVTQYADSTPGGFHGDLVAYYKIPGPREDAVLQAMNSLKGDVGVSVDRNTGMISMTFATTSPSLSSAVVRRFLDIINDYNLQRRKSQARSEREFVSNLLQEADSALRAAEEAHIDYLRRNRSITAPEQQADNQRFLRRVQQREAAYLNLAQSFDAAKIEEVRSTPVITIIERPEGFVTPEPRGTVRKTITGGFVGLFLGIFLAFGLDYVSRVRERRPADFVDFVDQLPSIFRRKST